jgi:prophage lambdaSa04, mannosyl-glycoprotein endo-beta-N-acetylglucosamidase family protein|nr:MAG TPA: N-acetylmuramoyl-L-alanine amidase [Caudoviricetes sp.]
MADSQLVDYEKYSPNISSPRNHEIDTISIHTMAGNLTVETCGNIFANPNYECSSQYGIGSDGRIGQYVSEGDRSWCTSSRSNDNRAITIEVASYESDTYACTDAAMESLINLLVDICQRNGIDQLRWQADPDLIGEVDQQNMTVHRWFAQKSCPGPYLFEKHGYIADEVNKRLGNPSYRPTNSNPESNADQFVKHFEMIGLNPPALCGLMGNIFAESGLIPNNLQNSFEDKLGMNDDAYTQAVDDGSYDNFVHDSAGYGLAQWTYYSRKEGLLNFAKEKGVSIGDMYMQMDYLWQELQNTIDIAKLNACSTVREASDIILHEFERPADQSEEVEIRRAGYGQEFYNKYYGEPDAPAEFEAYNVRVTATLLNVRSGPGTNFGINSSIMDQGLYGICDESDGQGASSWGKMSNGWGWISLDYTERE